MRQKYARMVISLHKELKEKIEKIAKERDMKISAIVRQALKEWLKHG